MHVGFGHSGAPENVSSIHCVTEYLTQSKSGCKN
jgi:hypothetical protein